MENRSTRPVYLAGPTGVGKSAVALELAELLNGEIISVDSMQVYRGLNIGTAKPSAAERQRAPHHLIDVADLRQSFDAAQFVSLAGAAAHDIQERGRWPIFCGGTGLYFKAYLEGLGPAPPKDLTVRAELEATPLAVLLEELQRADPVTFAAIDRQNPRRIIRALEVIRLTGRPFSEQRAKWNQAGLGPRVVWLSRPAGELVERIHQRVDDMFRRGLVAETEALLRQGLAESPTAMQALGYRQVVEHLGGTMSLAETIELVKIRTRQYAKRQRTWFQRQMRVREISLAGLSMKALLEILVDGP